MQPAASSTDGTAVKLFKGEVADTEGLMNEAAFVRKNAEDVPADQVKHSSFIESKETYPIRPALLSSLLFPQEREGKGASC